MATVYQEDISVNQVSERLTTAEWFHKAGIREAETEALIEQLLSNLNVDNYQLKWIDKSELVDVIGRFSLQDSELWNKLKEIPDELKEKIDANNDTTRLEKLIDRLPEAVFHPAFDGAYKQCGEEKRVGFLTGNAMYLSVLIATAELAGEGELLKPLLQVIENGHVPVGIEGNVIYLL